MDEDLRTFENKKGSWTYEGGYTLKLTKSTLSNHKDLPEAFNMEFVKVKDGQVVVKADGTISCYTDESKFSFSSDEVVEIRKEDASLLWINHERMCPVCGAIASDIYHDHVIRVVSGRGDPIAIVVDMQPVYDNSHRKARLLALAHAELKKYFPDKSFSPMTPSRLMLTKHGENNVLLGEAYVASYLTVEI